MASCDPMESPSGRAWEVMRNRVRSLMAWQMSAGAESAVADVIVPNGVMPGRGLRFELLEDLFDAILTSDGFVEEELELRDPRGAEAADRAGAEGTAPPA